jgi:hypothetical protein
VAVFIRGTTAAPFIPFLELSFSCFLPLLVIINTWMLQYGPYTISFRKKCSHNCWLVIQVTKGLKHYRQHNDYSGTVNMFTGTFKNSLKLYSRWVYGICVREKWIFFRPNVE